MANQKSIASTLIFLGSAMCFFLPFVTVSCGGVTAFTLTGQQLVTGTTLSQPQAFGPPQTQRVGADPFAIVAALCALAGIALSMIGRRIASGAAISGGVGAVSLLIMRSRLDEQLQKQSEGLAKATYEAGFTLAVLLLIAGAAWNVYLYLQMKRISEASKLAPVEQSSNVRPPVQSESPPLTLERQARICPNCAQPIRATARFCESCGRSAEITEGSPEAQTPLKRGD
jgi:hypothetical protein